MKEQIIKDIKSYIKFLESNGYTVSLSFINTFFASFAVELMQYDFHPHAVCNYLKKNPSTLGMCVHDKSVVKKMKLKSPRYSCCFAGVEEYIIPFTHNETPVCYIHVSGYRNNFSKSALNMKKTAAKCGSRFKKLYYELAVQVPDMKTVLSFVNPLLYVFESLYNLYESETAESANRPSKNYYVKALQFIHENYSSPITCLSIAEHLKYSESYVRYIFKKEGNTSPQAKINEIRLYNAKRLLKSTNMSITEIAFGVGFGDSNYFSAFFKAKEKITPREYRKKVNG